MKKLFLIGAMMLFAGSLFAQGIKFETGSVNDAFAKAKAQNKYVFMDVYAEWCGPCKRMASEVFTQKKVGDYFNATFINMKVNAEEGEGIAIAKKYSVRNYPTFFILDSNGNVVGKMIGGDDADGFIARIKELVSKAKK